MSTIDQHKEYLASLDEEVRKPKIQQMESIAERAAANEHLHTKGKGAIGLAIGATLALVSGASSASSTSGDVEEKTKAFKESTINSATDMLPVINAEKAMQEGKPNEAIARLATGHRQANQPGTCRGYMQQPLEKLQM